MVPNVATLAQVSRQGFMIRTRCKECQRWSIFDPTELLRFCGDRPVQWLRFRCIRCGSRSVDAHPEFVHGAKRPARPNTTGKPVPIASGQA